MENKTTRLHPLLTAAAISVTAFSAVGIGAMTGLLPHSFGSAKEAAPQEIVAPAVTPPAPETKVVEMPPAAPKATPKPAKKVIKAVAPAPAPVVQDFGEAPRIAEAPKPIPAGLFGTWNPCAK
jgi:hypothetical protein